jgi:hypothetical protein
MGTGQSFWRFRREEVAILQSERIESGFWSGEDDPEGEQEQSAYLTDRGATQPCQDLDVERESPRMETLKEQNRHRSRKQGAISPKEKRDNLLLKVHQMASGRNPLNSLLWS